MKDDNFRNIKRTKQIWSFVKIYWKGLFITLYPICLLPIIFCNQQSQMFRCMYIFSLMAGLWVTEALPITITSILPLALFPVLGVMDTKATTSCYVNDTIMMFMGSLLIAIAIEHCALHERIALWVIMKIGISPPSILFGVMAVTAAISMWVSNTAVTSMMIPIVDAILNELDRQGVCKKYDDDDSEQSVEDAVAKPHRTCDVLRRPSQIATCFFISTSYASSLGGFATLVGTGTNLVLKGNYENKLKESLDFTKWMLFSTPVSALCLTMIWVSLQVQFMGLFRKRKHDVTKTLRLDQRTKQLAQDVICANYRQLGAWTQHQISVAVLFFVALLLWIFRKPPLIPGWPTLLTNLEIKDSTVAFIVGSLLLILPSKWNFLNYFRADFERENAAATEPLLPWTRVNQKMPWGLMFLLGGGFALSKAFEQTGLNDFIKRELNGLKDMPPTMVMLTFALVANICTEFTSNITLASILLPILIEIADLVRVHPLFLMVPATLNCSMAFMMPAGTPPNAVVIAAANVRVRDFIRAGIVASIVTFFVTSACFLVFGLPIFSIH